MAGLPDATNIGSDKPVQNPQDAVEANEGKYHDAAADLPLADGIDTYAPRPAGPKPY